MTCILFLLGSAHLFEPCVISVHRPCTPAMQEDPEAATLRQFKEAAQRLHRQRELEALPPEERVVRRFQEYMQEWKEDLDARPPAAAKTTVGLQVTSH
jgi:hypothetical protein